uniref:GTP cyclohydrolase 1 n=1 Tax=Peptoclostridium acidaminophilum TaxID=1731 RepID=Q5XZD5_PEPAC|nr:GTP-cyclohydrolase [Peptoclostridium acidaminophilum]
MDKEKIQKSVRDIIEAIGEDPDREGLEDTPDRMAKMYEENIFVGLNEDPKRIFGCKIPREEKYEEIVLVKDIPFHSVCEHHFVPFFGKAHVAYIPKGGRLTGLSKLARVVDVVAKRPQLQERISQTVLDIIMKLQPYGVVVVIEAEHMCMTMRGVKKPGSTTVTSAIRGIFKNDTAARAEIMSLIK